MFDKNMEAGAANKMHEDPESSISHDSDGSSVIMADPQSRTRAQSFNQRRTKGKSVEKHIAI